MLGAGRGSPTALRLVAVELAVDLFETLTSPVALSAPAHASVAAAPTTTAPDRCPKQAEDEEEEEQREEKAEEPEAEAEPMRSVVVRRDGRPGRDLRGDVLRYADLVPDDADDGEDDQSGD